MCVRESLWVGEGVSLYLSVKKWQKKAITPPPSPQSGFTPVLFFFFSRNFFGNVSSYETVLGLRKHTKRQGRGDIVVDSTVSYSLGHGASVLLVMLIRFEKCSLKIYFKICKTGRRVSLKHSSSMNWRSGRSTSSSLPRRMDSIDTE